MSKVYVAAAWKRREDAASAGAKLRSAGFKVISSWHDGPKDWEGVPTPERMKEIAIKDANEVADADILVGLTDPPGSGQPYGSRHVEFGMAYALDKAIALIGPRELMFHHLPDVLQFDTVEDYIDAYFDVMS